MSLTNIPNATLSLGQNGNMQPGILALDALEDQILLHIFYYAMGTLVTDLPPGPLDVKISLSQVCKKWRSLIVNTPIFWSYFNLYPTLVQRPAYLRKLTRRWLHRGKGFNLHLKFYDRPSSAPNVGYQPASVFHLMYAHGRIDIIASIIKPFAKRILSLDLILCTKSVIKSFLKIPPASFPKLESVELTFINDIVFAQEHIAFSDTELRRFSIFHNFPRLRNTTIRMYNGIHPQRLTLPWGTLTTLDMGTVALAPELFMIIIRTSHSLGGGHFLVAFTPQSDDENTTTMEKACGASIERLHIRLINPSNDTRMFCRLTFPVLRQLRIDLYDPLHGWQPSIIMEMLSESSSTLEFLTLTDFIDPPSTLDHERLLRRRRQLGSSTSYTEFDEFMETAPNLRGLSLPFLLQVNSVSLDNFAKGKLLPNLNFLSIPSLQGTRVIYAIRARIELTDYNSRQPGTSSTHGIEMGVPCTLSSVNIAVPRGEKYALDQEVSDILKKLPCIRTTAINIIEEDIRHFLR